MRFNSLEQQAVDEWNERAIAKAASMAPQEVAAALRRHLARMEAQGASALPSAILERAAEIIEGLGSDPVG